MFKHYVAVMSKRLNNLPQYYPSIDCTEKKWSARSSPVCSNTGYSKCLTHSSEWSIISAVWDSEGKSRDGRFHERGSRTGPTLTLKGLLSFKTARSSGFIPKMKWPQLMKPENYTWLLDVYKSKLCKIYRFRILYFILARAVEDMCKFKSLNWHKACKKKKACKLDLNCKRSQNCRI